jgi:hypothetical protein
MFYTTYMLKIFLCQIKMQLTCLDKHMLSLYFFKKWLKLIVQQEMSSYFIIHHLCGL